MRAPSRGTDKATMALVNVIGIVSEAGFWMPSIRRCQTIMIFECIYEYLCIIVDRNDHVGNKKEHYHRIAKEIRPAPPLFATISFSHTHQHNFLIIVSTV